MGRRRAHPLDTRACRRLGRQSQYRDEKLSSAHGSGNYRKPARPRLLRRADRAQDDSQGNKERVRAGRITARVPHDAPARYERRRARRALRARHRREAMRKSQIAVLSAAAAVALIIVGAIVAARIIVAQIGTGEYCQRAPDTEARVANLAADDLDLSGCDRIDARGTWEVSVTQGAEWDVSLEYSDEVADELRVRVGGDGVHAWVAR